MKRLCLFIPVFLFMQMALSQEQNMPSQVRATARLEKTSQAPLDTVLTRDTLSTLPRVRIILKDKRVIEGALLSETDDDVRIKTDEGVTYQLPKSRIDSQTRVSWISESSKTSPLPSTPSNTATGFGTGQAALVQDVVVLKGGSIVKGKILKYEPLMVQIADSTILTLNMDEVTSITKQEVRQGRAPSRPLADATTSTPPAARLTSRRTSLWSIFGGVSMPVGSLGETSGNNAGFASSGFAVGFDGAFGSDVAALSAGLLFAINSSDVSSQFSSIGGASGESGSWKNFWGTVGGRVFASLTPSIRLYGEGVIGTLIGVSPELKLTITVRDPTTFRTITVSATQEPSTAVAFAYGVGVGITISRFSLAFRFLTGEPEYEFKATASGAGTSATVTQKYKQPTSLIILTAGITF